MFTNKSQNIECNDVLLKSNVANIVQHGPITITIDCNALSLLILKEKWPNYASGPKSTPNTGSFWVRRLFNVCVRVFCALNFACLYIRQDQNELHLNRCFFLPSSAYSVSRPVVIYLSIVQVYTQPYSFGGRIKLTICQVRHDQSVTFYEISTSWKTMADLIEVKNVSSNCFCLTNVIILNQSLCIIWIVLISYTSLPISFNEKLNNTSVMGDRQHYWNICANKREKTPNRIQLVP